MGLVLSNYDGNEFVNRKLLKFQRPALFNQLQSYTHLCNFTCTLEVFLPLFHLPKVMFKPFEALQSVGRRAASWFQAHLTSLKVTIIPAYGIKTSYLTPPGCLN
jgi:hypothetical protein